MLTSAPNGAYGETNLGLEDNYGPCKLDEEALTSVLTQLAKPESIADVDCITFQPCLSEDQANQDRYAVETWTLDNRDWKFLAIFDGHAGDETVEYVAATLPSQLKSNLSSVLQPTVTTTIISDVLRNTVVSFDESLTNDLLNIFPGGLAAIANKTDEDIGEVINDQGRGTNYVKVARCMQGSTVLIALLDPAKENLWVSSLGDSQAVLGVRQESGKWDASILSANHNAREESEIQRIKSEHKGEEEKCVLENRVLGGIAVTRAVGDHLFKLESEWTSRVFLRAHPGFQFKSSRPAELVNRILTPPYLSNKSEVQHIYLKNVLSPGSGREQPEAFLILCSDGLLDLGSKGLKRASRVWMSVASDEGIFGSDPVYKNRALRILRKGLGGKDTDKVAQYLTVEMGSKWLDDVTVLVVAL